MSERRATGMVRRSEAAGCRLEKNGSLQERPRMPVMRACGWHLAGPNNDDEASDAKRIHCC